MGADRAVHPSSNRIGRLRRVDLREIVNAILFIAATGCPWRFLPKNFPPFTTVQGYFINGVTSDVRRGSIIIWFCRTRSGGSQGATDGRRDRQPKRQNH
jgi:transposase